MTTPHLERAAPGVVACLAVVGLGFGQGGYFPVAWGWAAVALGWAALLALVARRDVELSVLEWIALAAWTVLAAWTAASAVWSVDVAASVFDAERTLVYLTAVGGLLILGRRGSAIGLVVAVWAGILVVTGFALATHLSPRRFGLYVDPIQTGRVFEPIGYCNSLGLMAAMGVAIALGLAARRSSPVLGAAAAGSLPLLATTLYFTFSRGASLALAAGVVAVAALSAARVRYLAVACAIAPWPAIAVWAGAHSAPLRAAHVQVLQASAAGERLAVALAACAVCAAAVVLAWHVVERRFGCPRAVRSGFILALCVMAVASVPTAIWRFGSPVHVADEVRAGLLSRPAASDDLGARLTSLSLDGRKELWQVALADYRRHALLGSGGGSFRRTWYAERPADFDVRDAHSLELQTLAELGPTGLILLVVALGCPLVAAVRLRRDPLVPAAAGAYVVFLVHATIDWDWQLPAVTLAALGCGAALLLADRSPHRARRVRRPQTAVLAAATCVALAAATGGLAGNLALSEGRSDLAQGNAAGAVAAADRAERWMPWSYEPSLLRGQAYSAAGSPAQARAAFRSALATDPGVEDAWTGLWGVAGPAEQRRAVRQLERINPLGG